MDKSHFSHTLIPGYIGAVCVFSGILLGSCILPNLNHSQPTRTPIALPTEIVEANGLRMNLVPAGDFMMGSDDDVDGFNNSHSLFLDAFYMDVYEITNAHFAECVQTTVCQPPQFSKTDFRPNYYGNPEYDDFPVIYVNWYQSKTYCEWRGARLPTEAEWEKAARGTDGRSYPWGEGSTCERSNYDGYPDDFASFCVGDTAAVGSYENGKSPYGLYDMAGNVFEWVSSLYQPYPYDPADGREDPTRGGSHVIRGGAWSEGPDDQKVFYRSYLGSDQSETAVGFRCARDASP